MATESESTPASSSTFDEDVKKLMGKGKVHLVCNENLEAVKCFEEAAKKLDEKFGEAADECGEAYLYYGKSLLEVARMEGGVLGNALQGAIDTNVQENGDDGEKKCEEEGEKEEETKGSETEDKKQDLFVKDELNDEEKEKIGMDVTEAMTEEAFKEAIQEDAKDKDGQSSEKKEKEPSGESIGKESTSEEKETNEDQQLKETETKMEDKQTEEAETKVEDGPAEEAETKKEDGPAEEAEIKKPEEKQEGTSEENKEEEKNEENENAEGAEEEGGEEGDEDEPMEGTEDDEAADAAPEEEEPTYMELAWQILEAARIIFTKRETKEGKLLLAQCYLKLGEIQMEQEQFLGAVNDFLKCLDIQKEHLEPDDRLIAETAYNIGLAFSFQSMHEKSKTYYSQALETIDLRIKTLQKNIDEAESKSKGKEKATDDNPFVANRKELQELQELYPEIKAKVDDATEMMTQSKTQPSISSVMGNGSSTTIGFGQSSCTSTHSTIATKEAPVAATDISHLVHRNKRKPEEASEDDTVAKKPRQDPEVAESNGKPTNGNAEATPSET